MKQMSTRRIGGGASPGQVALLATLALAVAPFAAAFQLVPIQATFRPTGPESVQTFRLENPSDQPVAIEISVAKREMNEDGSDRLTPDEESFVVVPTQIVLRPKQVQAVRVQWVGASELATEAAFRLIAEQVPVEIDAKATGGGRLRMLVRYVASLYVGPAGLTSNLAVEGVERSAAADGSPRLAISVVNRGAAHTVLREPRLVLSTAGGAREELAAGELAGQNFLAGARRRFLVVVPPGLGDGAVAAELLVP